MPPYGWKYERIEVTRLDWLLEASALSLTCEPSPDGGGCEVQFQVETS